MNKNEQKNNINVPNGEDLENHYLTGAELEEVFNSLSEKTKESLKRIDEISSTFQASDEQTAALHSMAASAQELRQIIIQTADKIRPYLERVKPFYDYRRKLEPYLKEELQKPEYNGAEPENVLVFYNPITREQFRYEAGELSPEWLEKNRITPEQAEKAFKAAQEAYARACEKVQHPQALTSSVSKPDSLIWNKKAWSDKSSEYGFNFNVSSASDRRNHPERRIELNYTFDITELRKKGMDISSPLTSYDRAVYTAVSAIRDASNEYFTLRQVFEVMEGRSKRPSKNQLEKIGKSIEKMSRIRVQISNGTEATYYKHKQGSLSFRKATYILAVETVSAYINGQYVETCYHFLTPQLPLIDVPKSRGEITTVPADFLQIPLSKTDDTMDLLFYLQRRVSMEKSGTCTVLFNTIFDSLKITEAKQKQRTPQKVEALLEHLKRTGLISSFKIQKDRAVMIIPVKKKIPAQATKKQA